MMALGSQTLHRSPWTHHSSNPTTRLTDSNLQPPPTHMHKGYRQNTLQHHCQITYRNTRPQVWELSDTTFHILCTTYLFTNKHNMEVFVNSSSFKKGQFTVKLLKEHKQGLKAWTVDIIIFVAFNWSRLYISIVHHLLVDTITHPCITNLFASAICICCHCENNKTYICRSVS
jgi:hypothetical protein